MKLPVRFGYFLLLLGALSYSLGTPLASLADDQEVHLGSILILSGEGASWGTAAKNGIEMAVDKLNASGGILGRRVVARHQDDQGDAKKTIAAFHQLTDASNVHFIIGPSWSRLGLPLIEMATRKKTVIISPTLGMAKFNESSEYLFNTRPHDYISSEKLAEHVYNKGHRNVALVGAEEPWVKEQSESFTKRFTALGGTIGFLTEPLPGTTDLRTEAIKIAQDESLDALVSTTDGVIIGSLLAKSLKELGHKMPLYSVTLDQAAIDAAQGGFEGLEFVTFFSPDPEFQQEYEARFKTTIDVGADSAFDAVMMLASAIKEAGSLDTTAVAKELAKIREFKGVSGVLTSDGKRGFVKDCVVKTIRSGKPIAAN